MVATSRAFVQGDRLLFLARVADTWRCRPSQLLGLATYAGPAAPAKNGRLVDLDATTALQIDIAAAVALWQLAPHGSGEHEAKELWW